MDLVDIPVERQWPSIAAVAGRVEAAGYESVWVFDHLVTTPEPGVESTFEAWTTLTALAAVTERVRLGVLVTAPGYRNPALLAKVAATLDVVSGGRVEFGVGAGWEEAEYRAYGIEFPAPAIRVAMLRETIEIARLLWSGAEVSYAGTVHRLEGAIGRPRPLQRPGPPVWVGGSGRKRTLRVTAELADVANLLGDPAEFAAACDALDSHCEAVGRDPSTIARTVHVDCLLTNDPSAVERAAAQRGQSAREWSAGATNFVGSVERVTEELSRYRDAGCSTIILSLPDAVWGTTIEEFAERVAPALGGHPAVA